MGDRRIDDRGQKSDDRSRRNLNGEGGAVKQRAESIAHSLDRGQKADRDERSQPGRRPEKFARLGRAAGLIEKETQARQMSNVD